jgi:hypothetical protein
MRFWGRTLASDGGNVNWLSLMAGVEAGLAAKKSIRFMCS